MDMLKATIALPTHARRDRVSCGHQSLADERRRYRRKPGVIGSMKGRWLYLYHLNFPKY